MVKINEKEKWQKVEEKGYVDEKELQEMLAASPDLIPVEELGGGRKPIKVAVREAGLPGSGHTDLIGIDEDGNITIVETKLADNPEIKRKVIGQILEYAAYLWQKSYEEFDEIIRRKLNEYLLDRMQKEIKDDEEWSAEEFRDAVEANLKNGIFTLFIVVDSINEELRRIIDYLNSKDFTNFSLYALELKNFREKGVAIVLPQLYGAASRSSKGAKGPAINTEERYLAHAREVITDPRMLNLLLDLYDFSKANADDIPFGAGGTNGRIWFTADCPNASNGAVPIFQLKSSGVIKINFWGITKTIPGSKGERLSKELFKRLSVLPAIKKWYEQTEQKIKQGKRPAKEFIGANLPLNEVFPDDASLKVFKSAVLDAKKEIQRTLSN